MEFKFKDAEAALMRAALFLKANNVVFRGFVVFPSFLLMQQFQLFCTLPMYIVKALVKLRNFQ